METKKRIAPLLRQARKEKGYSVKQVAEILGVTEGTIRHYESGRREPPLSKLEQLAEILDVHLFDLIAPPGVAKILLSWSAALEELPPERLKLLRELLEDQLQRNRATSSE